MLQFIVVLCDTNHSNYTTRVIDANNVDRAAVRAVEIYGDRQIVKGVVEVEDDGKVMAALRQHYTR